MRESEIKERERKTESEKLRKRYIDTGETENLLRDKGTKRQRDKKI